MSRGHLVPPLGPQDLRPRTDYAAGPRVSAGHRAGSQLTRSARLPDAWLSDVATRTADQQLPFELCHAPTARAARPARASFSSSSPPRRTAEQNCRSLFAPSRATQSTSSHHPPLKIVVSNYSTPRQAVSRQKCRRVCKEGTSSHESEWL